ncbi:MAG: glycosyltransferase family 2 protein [Sphingopyxis sp.]
MRVAIVIVGYNNAADIAACLAALAAQTHPAFHVVICENGDAGAYARLRDAVAGLQPGGQPPLLIAAPDNPGYAGGVNRGIAATPGADAWWVLNPDTVPDAPALAALVARAQRGDADVIGGTLYRADGTVQSHGGRWRSHLARVEAIGMGMAVGQTPDSAAIEQALDYQTGASMLVTRRVIDMIGPMREDYFLYCEEVEWCLRAKAAGLKLGFAPGARVLHHQGATTGSADGIRARPRLPIYLDERNKINMVRDTRPHHLPMAIPAALALLVLRFGRGRAWAQMRYAAAGWWAGVRNQRGKPGWLTQTR